MQQQDNEFSRSLAFLKKLNAVRYKGVPLSEQKIFGEYNVWIFFQSALFFRDIKPFMVTGSYRVPQAGFRVSMLSLGLKILSLAISFIAIVGMLIRRPAVLVYSSDKSNSSVAANDSRLDPVYRFLGKKRVRYIEVFHTVFGRSFLGNLARRRRFAVYVKSIDTLYSILVTLGFLTPTPIELREEEFSAFDGEERDFAKYLAAKYLGEIERAAFRTRILLAMLKRSEIRAVLTIDNPRDYWELILAARLAEVQSYAFQHGHFTKYHVGWLNDGEFNGIIASPDRLYVWSEYWKSELLRLGTYFRADQMIVGGAKEALPAAPAPSRSLILTVCIPFEIDSDKEMVQRYVDELLAHEDVCVIFKLRADMPAEKQLELYGLSKDYHSKFSAVTDIKSILSEVSVFAGTYSTFLYDMVAYEKPVALLETRSDFGEGLLVHNLADQVTLEGAYERLVSVSNTSSDLLKERKLRLFGDANIHIEDTISALGRELGFT